MISVTTLFVKISSDIHRTLPFVIQGYHQHIHHEQCQLVKMFLFYTCIFHKDHRHFLLHAMITIGFLTFCLSIYIIDIVTSKTLTIISQPTLIAGPFSIPLNDMVHMENMLILVYV